MKMKTITSRNPEIDFVDTIIERERRAFQLGMSIGTFLGWIIGACTVAFWWSLS